ncbi:carboxypeptidase regulatory-like domain-containing protein [Geomonas sp. RF6]|uniref:carboxypeptidase regulatory-like domain-containing protein n=1 Tax=Geomonas sp. RF6 TaxID=2897342 RepID=UPI001E36FA39|nr:carboxypeptidase regulatory-like domain-containing protein [Geomonas sp. RF6]UFS71405.1 carboxypeptidase regulatory-like domain-containing protein [Geomonas sp. RF6]
MSIKRNVAAVVLLILSLLVAGCGGGGGGGTATPAAPSTFTISGRTILNGSGLSGVTVTIAQGSAVSTATTDASGIFQGGVADGTYTITPALAGYTFAPASQTITVSGGNLSVPQNFSATAAATSFTVSGKVTVGGTALPGVAVTIAGAKSASTVTDGSGNYSFSGVPNGLCTVTPVLSGYTFSPLSRTVTVSNADLTVSDFAATATPPATTFTVSGKVTLNGSGLGWVSVQISSMSGLSGNLITNATGNFSFTDVPNGDYTITPAINGYIFTPASRTVTVTNGNATVADFTAASTAGSTGSVTFTW